MVIYGTLCICLVSVIATFTHLHVEFAGNHPRSPLVLPHPSLLHIKAEDTSEMDGASNSRFKLLPVLLLGKRLFPGFYL